MKTSLIHSRTGFTLVELLVSTAIITLLMVVLVSITGQTSTTWRYTSGKIEQFRAARAAFDSMTSKLSQATLNTYWDYDNVLQPTRYERRSELRFASGPVANTIGERAGQGTRLTHSVFFHTQAGLVEDRTKYQGLEGLLNVWGYYVEYNDDSATRPPFLTDEISPPRWRHRLMEFTVPADRVSTYLHTSGVKGSQPNSISYTDKTWYTTSMAGTKPPVHPIAENIVALIITPRLPKREEQEVQNSKTVDPDFSPLAPNYSYDSSPAGSGLFGSGGGSGDARLNPVNQLPPVVQVTMVAIDEPSAIRLNLRQGSADIFGTKGKFTDTKKYSKDLLLDPSTGDRTSLENTLVGMGVKYRTFSTNIPIRGAKWSRHEVKK